MLFAFTRPHIRPVMLDKDEETHLSWDENKKAFRLYVNNNARNETYNWDEIRSSVAYRGWCFKTEEEMNDYDPKSLGDLTLDDILNTLKQDLISRKRVSKERLNRMTPYEFGQFLMDEYIKLPMPPKAIIPYNYCMAIALIPQWIMDVGFVKYGISVLEDWFCSGM